jgi:coenzyme F420-reducing hydrogenase gamma subunit
MYGCSCCGKYFYDVSKNKVRLMKKLHVKVCKLVDDTKFTVRDFDDLIEEGSKAYKNKFNTHYRINKL